MAELTLGQTLDDLVFRMGRVENFIVKLVRLQQLRLNDSSKLQAEVIEIGNAILKSRIFPNGKKIVSEEMINCRCSMLSTKDSKSLIQSVTKKTLPVECPPCHMRFKNKMALRAHITNDANWGRRKFRALHKEPRTKQVWR